MYLLRFAQQIRIGSVACGKPLHLTILGAVVDGRAAVDVVIAELSADDYVLHVDVVAIASGTAAGDDAVGVELVDHALGTQGGVNLTDATLLNQHVIAVEELL